MCKHMDAWKVKEAWFRKQYPNACSRCGALGFKSYSFDPSPAGVSLAPGSMTDWEWCEECMCEGRCSLCGAPVITAEMLEGERFVCPACGQLFDPEATLDGDNDYGLEPASDCECCSGFDNPSECDDSWLESAYEDRTYGEEG